MPVNGYEGLYEISNIGRFKSLSKKRNGNKDVIVKLFTSCHGYLKCTISKRQKRNNIEIHRLVATHFVVNINNKPCVNHKDGNKQNNVFTNLEWVTTRENNIHAIRSGLSSTKHLTYYNSLSVPTRKLSPSQVLRIRLLKDVCPAITNIKLASMFKIKPCSISLIINRNTWKNI